MTIRPWTTQDIPAIQNVLLTTWRSTYGSFIPLEDIDWYFTANYDANAFEKLLAASDVDGFVAEESGQIVGFARTLFDEGKGRFYVSSMYVLPEFQGRGIGHGLLKAAEKCALKRGADRIWLGVMSQNRPALEWYRRIGFTFVEDEPFTMGKTTVRHLIGYRVIGV